MKKILFMAAMFAATVCNAQVELWNGEDKEIGSDGGFWNRADPTVVDDNGNKCLKVTLKANPGGWDQEHHNIALPVGDADFKGLRRLTFRMKMEDKHNVMVQLEGKDGAYNVKRIFWYDTPGEWQTMVYEYSVGPDEDKITDTSNNVIAIWPYEETADGEGKTIYIDDIQLEGPMLKDGAAIRTLADGSLTSKQVEITGSLSKGQYQCTWDGDWHPEAYDDYALLAAKLAPTATKLDVSGAGRWDEDWDVIKAKCPGIEIITETSTGIQQTNMYQDATNETYTITGMRVATPTEKGIYIVGGRKVLVK
jgi:hypothetical protein